MRGVNYQQATAPPGQFRAVTAGDFHTGVLQADGTAQCWDGTTSDKRTRLPDRDRLRAHG